jgi:hypothetical protein
MAKISTHDAYIQAAAPFARPILKHFRTLVHKACPAVEETINGDFLISSTRA